MSQHDVNPREGALVFHACSFSEVSVARQGSEGGGVRGLSLEKPRSSLF